jgi:hypothetical protein
MSANTVRVSTINKSLLRTFRTVFSFPEAPVEGKSKAITRSCVMHKCVTQLCVITNDKSL